MKLELICQVPEDKKHQDEIESFVILGDRLFSGADDGVIKIWSTKDLQLLHEFKAHDYAINNLLIVQDRLFSASMDQTIKSWQLDTWKLVATFTGHLDSPRKLATDGELIYCGDDNGEVIKWSKDGEPLAKYAVVEEVWDLYVQGPLIYTVRDRGLTISEAIPNSLNFTVMQSIEGRAPFYIKDNYLLMIDRAGTTINYFRNVPPTYDYVKEFKGHEMIITTMTAYKGTLLTAGYDEKLFAWDLKSGEQLTTIPLKGCPNDLAVTEEGEIFIALPEGVIVKMKLTA